MKIQKINFKDKNKKYSILIGNNILQTLPKKIRELCPNSKKIVLVFDSNVPSKFKNKIKRYLKNYTLMILDLKANEKTKSLKYVNYFLNKLLENNLTDLIL